jgi:hypothetical protein
MFSTVYRIQEQARQQGDAQKSIIFYPHEMGQLLDLPAAYFTHRSVYRGDPNKVDSWSSSMASLGSNPTEFHIYRVIIAT